MNKTKQRYIDKIKDETKNFTKEDFEFLLWVIEKINEKDRMIYENTPQENWDCWKKHIQGGER